MPKLYGWVREVTPEGPADLAGVQPGDLLRTINGHPVRDLVDYQFYAAEEELLLEVERNGRQLEILVAKGADEEMGILFGEEPAPFIRICANKCVFCFIKGLAGAEDGAARAAAGHARLALHQGRRLPLQLPLRQLHHAEQPQRAGLAAAGGAAPQPALRLGAYDES